MGLMVLDELGFNRWFGLIWFPTELVCVVEVGVFYAQRGRLP